MTFPDVHAVGIRLAKSSFRRKPEFIFIRAEMRMRTVVVAARRLALANHVPGAWNMVHACPPDHFVDVNKMIDPAKSIRSIHESRLASNDAITGVPRVRVYWS